MKGYLQNIEEITLKNEYFRQVLFTGQHAQLVVMAIQPGEEIGMEIHEISDQFLRIEDGEGKVIMDGEEHLITNGDALMVPSGTKHNVVNTSTNKPLKLYTVYSPSHHKK